MLIATTHSADVTNINYRFMALSPIVWMASLVSLPSQATAASIVSGGHIDAPAFGYDGGFEPHIHNEGGADGAIIDGVRVTADTEYEPDELIFQVKFSSTTSVDAVDYFWLPEVQQTAEDNSVPWMGIGFEELVDSGEVFVGDTLTISMQLVSGPTGGEVRLWQDDGFGGATDFINTATNTLSFQVDPFNNEDHIHVSWGFTEVGSYDLEFEISGQRVGQPAAESAAATYSFQVVPEPSTALLGVLGGLFLLRRRRD